MRASFSWLLITMFVWACSPGPNVQYHIGIQPLGHVPSEWTDSVAKALSTAYGAEVSVLPSKDLPTFAFINIKSPRYRADSLLSFLAGVRPTNMDLIVGITRHDISATKLDEQGKVLEPESSYSDWGVFGLGYLPGVSCVISSFRLNAESDLFINRICKVAIHEVGHNFGLPHCPMPNCVMRDAVEKLATIDAAPDFICPQCRLRLSNSTHR
jgi:archaemetzincin